jgi:DNA-binding MarR family transcriptional regulator
VTSSELHFAGLEDHRRVRDWRSTIQGFLRNSKNILKRHGATTLQYQSLLEIWATSDPRGLTVGELAKLLRVRHNTAVSVVNALCTKKLALRERSEEDRRVVHVRLTPPGRALLSALVGEHVQELDKISADLRKIIG